MENTKEPTKQKKKKQYFGTLVAEVWKMQKKQNNISVLLVFSTFTYKSPKIFVFLVFCIFHISPTRVPKYCFVLVFLVFSTFQLQESQDIVFAVLFPTSHFQLSEHVFFSVLVHAQYRARSQKPLENHIPMNVFLVTYVLSSVLWVLYCVYGAPCGKT